MYFVTQPFVYTVMGSLKIFKQCLSTGGGPRMKVKGEDSQTGIKLSQVWWEITWRLGSSHVINLK